MKLLIVYRLSYASRHATAGIASAFCECIFFSSEDERRNLSVRLSVPPFSDNVLSVSKLHNYKHSK